MKAARRHHKMRKRRHAKRLLSYWGIHADHIVVCIRGDTFTDCSCWMCGNPRKLGEITMQEKRNQGE